MAHAAAEPIIVADRAEFVDALNLLARGHMLVHVGDSPHGWAIDGAILRHCSDALMRYGLVDEFANPEGFKGVRYYRITARGKEFARVAVAAWRSRSVWERALVRLIG